MTLKITVPTQPDGSPRLHPETGRIWPHADWTPDETFDGGVLFTGPASRGVVTLADGTSYDVTPEVIEHRAGHAGPIVHHIELQYEAKGAISELDGSPFHHVCSEACGDERSA